MFPGTDGEHAAACIRHATRSHCLSQLGRSLRGGAPLQLPGVELQVAGQGPRVLRRSRNLTEPEQSEQILRKSFQGPKKGHKYWTPSSTTVSYLLQIIHKC